MNTVQNWLILVAACFTLPNLGSNVHAQEPATPENLVSALIDQNVAKDIELIDDQRNTIKELVRELVAIRTEIGAAKRLDFRNAPAEDREEIDGIYFRRFGQSQSKIASQMRDTLLPFQIERVEQLILQKELRQQTNRNSGGLLTPSMIEYLDISAEQQKQIRDRSQQLNGEVEKEIRKIIDRAQKKLLDELTVDQKSKYKKLLGEPMQPEIQAPNVDAKSGK